MRGAILLALGFVVSYMLATTLVPSLPEPLAYAPLMLACGLLVMHRAGSVVGGAWMLLGGILIAGPGTFWLAVVAAVVGGVLAERVFAARSVYALLGLGAATGGAIAVAKIVAAVVALIAGTQVPMGMVFGRACWEMLLLLIMLYGGFVLLHFARRTLSTLFVLR